MRIAFVLFIFLTGILGAVETNAPTRTVAVDFTEWSPHGTFYIQQLALTPSDVKQVWLVSSKNPKDRSLLFSHSRFVEVLISDDEHGLAINDHAGSDFADVRIFRQTMGIKYEQVEDITEKTWQFFAVKIGRKKPPELDHEYAEALRWTDDHTVLLCLHGHADEKNHIDDWLCLYDLSTRTFSTDFEKHNERHVTLQPAP